MEADDQEWIDDYFYMQSTFLNADQAMIAEAVQIEEMGLNAEVLNDRKAIAGNILRFD